MLLDTGNETDYCVISAYYLDVFKKHVKDIKVERKVMGTHRGAKVSTAITLKTFKFRLFSAKFHSRVGFTCQTNVNALDLMNIGIKGLTQFLNLIFPHESDGFYYCHDV